MMDKLVALLVIGSYVIEGLGFILFWFGVGWILIAILESFGKD